MHEEFAGHMVSHNIPMLALAILLCAGACYSAALAFARSRAAAGQQSFAWLAMGVVLIASGVWMLHFLAMMAMDPGLPVRFDPAYTAWSGFIVLMMHSAAYLMMRRTPSPLHMVLGGTTMVTGTFLMHQVGMLGYQLPAAREWHPGILAAGWAAGVVISVAVASLYRMAPGRIRLAMTPMGIVLATLAVHFICMAGVTYTPVPGAVLDGSGLSKTYLAVVIGLLLAGLTVAVAIGVMIDVMIARLERRANLRIAALTERLSAAEAEAALARRAKAEFLGAMSHELRTPLNGVVGMSSVLSNSALKPDQKQMVELICESAGALEMVISDVLDLSQADSGEMKIHPAPFDPRELTEACMALYRDRAFRRGLTLSARFEPGLERTYVGDARRIRQVLGNLVSNALKFTEKGSVEIVVSAQASEAHADRAALSFAVIDTGIGVALADQPHIFQAFRQSDNSNARRHGGTGLGLAIADHLARLMGGRITVDSEVGAGSVFRFQVAVRQDGEAHAGGAAGPEAASGWSLASRMSVLVIDDNPADQALLRNMLERLGASVTMAESQAEAQDMIRTTFFDLVVLDTGIAVGGGAADIQRMRKSDYEAGRRTPFLVCTGRAERHHQSDYLRAGANRVLEKPLDVEQFFAAVEDLCEADNTLSILNAGAA